MSIKQNMSKYILNTKIKSVFKRTWLKRLMKVKISSVNLSNIFRRFVSLIICNYINTQNFKDMRKQLLDS